MHRALATIAGFALALAVAGAADAKSCKDPKTGKFIKCPPAAAATVTTPPAAAEHGKPHCVKGVPCGNTCIAKGKVCHK